MEWSEDAIILGARRHGEGDTILEVMTHERGRHAGLVRGGRSKRLRPVLQAGNSVTVTWRARLEEHLGMFTVEPVALRAAQLMHDRSALLMAHLLCSYALLLPFCASSFCFWKNSVSASTSHAVLRPVRRRI